MKPVIGEDELKSEGFITTNFDRNNNIILAKNLYRDEFKNTQVYISSSEKIISYTGDKNFFIGKNGIGNPEALQKIKLNNENALGKNACIAYEIEVEIESFANKEISIILGAEDKTIDCKNIAYKYSKIANCKQELENIKNYWKDRLG